MDRLIKTLAVALIIFAVVLAFVVGNRMEQATITLLSGAAVGILLCAPAAAVITLATLRRKDLIRDERGQRYTSPLPQEPPTYWSVPHNPYVIDARRLAPGMGYLAPQGYGDANYALPARRKFYVIGENGDAQDADGDDR